MTITATARLCLAAAVLAATAAVAQETPPPPPPPAEVPQEGSPRTEAPAAAPAEPAPTSAPTRSAPIGGLPAPARRAPIAHHYGFFFRPDLGIGYLHAGASQSGNDVSLYGAGASLGIAVGGAVDRHNIIAFHIWGLSATNPTGSASGTTQSIDGSVTLVVMGPEYTYYSDNNLYFSLSPGLSQLSFETKGVTSNSSDGFGFRLALGKEWWVSDNWGLGLAGQFSFSANPDTGTNPPTWITWGLSVAFSATYN
jgi:hypothetical protein